MHSGGITNNTTERLRPWAIIIPLIVVVICMEVLIGWQFNNAYMKSVIPGLISMNPTTCVCLVVIALGCLARAAGRYRLVVVCGIFVALIGATKLYSLITGLHIPVDELLFSDKLANGYQGKPNRIALNTAANLLLTGLALTYTVGSSMYWKRLQHIFSGISVGLSILALNGYLYGLTSLSGLGAFLPMALNVACCFLLLNIVLLLPLRSTPVWLAEIRSNHYIRYQVFAGFLMIPLIFGLVDALMLHNIQALVASRKNVALSYGTVITLQDTLSALQDAETGQRGFILTGVPRYLDPYVDATRRLPSLLTQLDKQTQDKATVAELKQLAQAKLTELAQTIALEKSGQHMAAVTVIRTDVGKSIMDSFRSRITNLRAVELRSLAINQQQELAANLTVTIMVMIGTTLTISLLCVMYFLIVRQLRTQAQEQDRVERLIAERTAALNTEHSRLVASIESLAFGFIIIDASRQILSVNSASTKLLGSHVTLPSLSTAFQPGIDMSAMIEQCFADQRLAQAHNIPFKKKYIDIVISPIVHERATVGAVIILEDITEQVAIERSRDEFFSIASHELRTPLTAIRGNMSMAQTYFANDLKDPTLNELISDTHTASVRLIEIVNDFLDSSKLEQGKMTFAYAPVVVQPLVASIRKDLRILSDQHHNIVILDKSLEQLPSIIADEQRFRQVLSNLISNANKYSENAVITISGFVEGHNARIRITDTGKGIPFDNQTLLFRKFQQAGSDILTRDDTKGTGLGLYISRLLATSMHGSVELESSQSGKGSTFAILMPLAPTAMSTHRRLPRLR
jgi:signal transduction histidine kinase